MVYDGTLKDSKTQIALLKYSAMKDRGLLCPMSKENAE